jgi:transposase
MGAAMRGSDAVTGALFSYVDLEDRVPADHPLRVIRAVVNEVLRALDADFGAMYSDFGRQSIPPERLLRGSLIQAFYTVRSERQLMEQLDYNLLFRWFVGLGIDDPVWDHSTYSKNRDRLLEADIAKKFLAAILAHSQVAPLLSDDHFTVDGTMVQAWASMKSFLPQEQLAPNPPPPDTGSPPPSELLPITPSAGPPPETGSNIEPDAALPATPSTTEAAPMTTDTATKPKKSRNAEVDFHGQKRSNATHASVTDLQARLYKKGKGKEAKLSYIGHAMRPAKPSGRPPSS